MRKTLLFRLFGLGRIPREVQPRINREGVLLSDEGLAGSMTLRNYRAPGRYSSWRRNWFSGSLVATREHLLAFRYSKTVVGIAWDQPEIGALRCAVEERDRLSIGFDAGLFDERCSGEITIRYRTARAHDFLDIIRRRSRGRAGG